MKISVVMCTYNGWAYLQEQLDSLIHQHRQPDELVICDDQSTDQTLSLAKQFAVDAPFPVTVHLNPKQYGPASNFSQAIQKCTGDIILPCDQDDRWLPEKIATFEKLFAENPDCLLAFSDLAIMQTDGTPTTRTFWQDLRFDRVQQNDINVGCALSVLLRRNVVVGTAMGFRATLAARALPVPPAFMHDEWLALIASLLGRVQTIPEQLVSYRLHASQAVGSPSSVREQWRQAKKIMTPAYFANRTVRAQALAEAAEKLGNEVMNPKAVTMIRGLNTHATVVAKMHRSWPWRIPLIPLEIITGRYHHYDHGFKALARDLLL